MHAPLLTAGAASSLSADSAAPEHFVGSLEAAEAKSSRSLVVTSCICPAAHCPPASKPSAEKQPRASSHFLLSCVAHTHLLALGLT